MSWVFRSTSKSFLNFNRLYPLKISSRWSSGSLAALSNISPTRLTVLDNGLRVATEDTGIQTATVGLWLDNGSRSESNEVNGISHFLEHMLFKGTQKRSQTDLQLEVSNLGAQLHGRTSREHTSYCINCLSQDVPKAVDILSDIIQNSKLDETDIEDVKSTILRDMEDEESNIQKLILDNLHSVAYQGTSLAQTVNGTTDNIKSFQQADLARFLNNYYRAGNTVLVGSGGIDHDDLVKVAEQHFKGMNNSFTEENAKPIGYRYTGSDVRIIDYGMPLCHIALAQEGVGLNDPNYLPLMIATTLIGSWDKTHGASEYHASNLARFSHEFKLSHGFESFNVSYKDTGLWGIYFVSEMAYVDEMIHQIVTEWKRLCVNVSDFEIKRAINTYRTKLHQQFDTTHAISEDIGRQILASGRRVPVHELHERIEDVTADQVRDAMYKYIYNNCPVVSSMGSMDQTFDYNLIRSSMYWLRL